MATSPSTQKRATKAINMALKWAEDDFDPVEACDLEIALLREHIANGMTAEDQAQAERTIEILSKHGRRYNQHRERGKINDRKAA